jgi:hypothetical protein
MKCNLLFLILGLSLFISVYQLSAQNALPIAKPTSFSAGMKGSTGLQAYHHFTSWRAIAFGPIYKNGYINPFGGAAKFGLFGGSYNTATGTGALHANTTGYSNTADGYNALYYNTSGINNTAVGSDALFENNTGSQNVAIGEEALLVNSSGMYNTAVGTLALTNNTTGNSNTAMGMGAMVIAETENNSVAMGFYALSASNSSEGNNTSIGYYSMISNKSGYYNAAIGANALNSNISGYYNAAIGANALNSNSSGYYNAVNGALAMYANSTGSYNTASGAGALYSNTSGSNNVAVGEFSMSSNTTGSNNTVLGVSANLGSGALSNATALGANSVASASNSVVIGSSSVTSIGGYSGWTNFSDGRYKKNIQQNVPGLAFINKLNPITYSLDITGIENKLHESQKPISDKNLATAANYLNDPVVKQSVEEKSAVSYSGFVAQDVEKAADSVGYTFSGVDKPKDANQSFYGLRYGDFVVPLVKAVQELSKLNDSANSKIDSLQQQINELRAMILSKTQAVGAAIPGASLDQNVPNPTSNSTTIGYSLPQGATAAQMQITDMNGSILQIIPLSGIGRNILTIDTSSFASGTYSYSLFIDGQLAGTKKMVSVR